MVEEQITIQLGLKCYDCGKRLKHLPENGQCPKCGSSDIDLDNGLRGDHAGWEEK